MVQLFHRLVFDSRHLKGLVRLVALAFWMVLHSHLDSKSECPLLLDTIVRLSCGLHHAYNNLL